MILSFLHRYFTICVWILPLYFRLYYAAALNTPLFLHVGFDLTARLVDGLRTFSLFEQRPFLTPRYVRATRMQRLRIILTLRCLHYIQFTRLPFLR